MSAVVAFNWTCICHYDGSRLYIVPVDHPYVQQFTVSVYPIAGIWRVKWRCFQTIEQDAVFATEVEARRFAAMLWIGPHYAHDEADDLDDCDKFWRELSSERKSS